MTCVCVSTFPVRLWLSHKVMWNGAAAGGSECGDRTQQPVVFPGPEALAMSSKAPAAAQ